MATFKIPGGAASKTLSIIDSTSMLANFLITDLAIPGIPDTPLLPVVPSFSFLVTNSTGERKILFDLGLRKDPENLPPHCKDWLQMKKWDVSSDKGVREVIEEHGLSGGDIEAVVWSHPHFDHTGDPSTFPPETKLVVGPGFKKAMLPGYPANPDAAVLESDYEGRELVEISFSGDDVIKIGRFPAIDYFGDGSFYLLDAPGHAHGHLCGLVRTTATPDGSSNTFMLLGADAIHHNGELRPSEYRPLPEKITPHPLAPVGIDTPAYRKHASIPFCPGHAIEHLQRHRIRLPPNTTPFFDAAITIDAEQAQETIVKMQELDARDDIFIMFAHDESSIGIIDTFPKTANNWKEKGWAEKTRWRFLKDLGGAVYKDSVQRAHDPWQ
ncbi:hypothetical protein KEM55_002018 [Ascosphaera atra]|nr:hypothetical protein KEM55_002018 [Ascosphaera atra]